VNQTSEVDEARYSSISPLQPIDDMFRIEDNVIDIGKGAGELNLIILIPKTEARAQGGEVTLKKILLDRMGNESTVFKHKIGDFGSKDTSNEELAAKVLKHYKGKMSSNVKKVRLMVEVFNLRTNELLGQGCSQPICDSSSKEHGALVFHTAFPLRCCAKGGRKVFMVCDSALAKDVEPRFQIYHQGRHLEDKDDLLQQPRLAGGQQVLIMKETLVFITPPQPHIETIMQNGWKIKLVGLRLSDKNISKTKFDFEYFPSDFYDPCIFCELHADGPSFPASLPALVGPARPGVKKRRMPEQKVTFAATAKALRLIRKPQMQLHDPSVPAATIPLTTTGAYPGDRERVLTFSQTTAIYNLFAVLDPDNTGYIPPETQNLVVDTATKEAVLLTELKAFIDEKKDTNGDGEVSFGEFLEAFRVHEDPGTTEHINELAEEFKLLKAAQEDKRD